MTPSIKLAIAMTIAMTPFMVWMGVEARRQWVENKNKHTQG